MNIENEIKAAIENSIKGGDIIAVVVPDVQAARDAAGLIGDDVDDAKSDGSLDVWGTVDGGSFRLRIYAA